MQTGPMTLEHVAAMPAPTWHFLRANDTSIQIPAGIDLAPAVQVRLPATARGDAEEFANALAKAQEHWQRSHPEPNAEELAERAALLAAENDATYGGTAQSAYQAGADALEDERSLAAAFEHGTGSETAAYLHYAAGKRLVIAAKAEKTVDAQVIVRGVENAVSAAAIDVVACPNSTVNLSILVDADSGQPENRMSGIGGITGTTVRAFAGRGSNVRITRVQTLDERFCDIDDTGLFAADGAQISVRQTVLGARRSIAGLAGDLRGSASAVQVNTHYLGHGEGELDFNYALRHHGTQTKSNLQANGVLAGRSQKTLRGTIDLVRGCKGAEGTENENVLLVDDNVHNKSVPVILCNEDDVAGNHGATIGHIRSEQLFYLESRGISREAAERMFITAVVEQAALDACDDAARTAVVAFGERLSPGFADSFEGEV